MMKPSTLLTTALSAAAAAAAGNDTSSDCATGLYMIVARGSGEPAGTGRMGTVASNVTERIQGCKIVPLDYPALFSGYNASEAAGVAAMRLAIETYVKKCPSGKYALLGWSQGAQVELDTICGTSEGQVFKSTEPIGTKLTENLVAVVGYGDPTHVAGLSWTLGTSKDNGIFPRQNTAACDPYASRIHTWCDTGDIYCDSGNITAVHSSYFAKYTTAAVDFIVERYNEALKGTSAGGNSSSGGSGSGSGSGSGNGGSSKTSSSTPSPTSSTTKNGAVRMSGGTLGYVVAGVLALMIYA